MARPKTKMARPNEVTCYCCPQSFLTHGHDATVVCPICADQGSRSLDLNKARSPGETGNRGEWRCDSCHRLFSGRPLRYYHDSALLCQTCRTKLEFDFAESSYVGNGKPKLFRRGRGGRNRLVVPPALTRKKQLALPRVYCQPSVDLQGKAT